MTKSLNIKPPVIAHRGASAYAPENTLAAFKKAKDVGATWVELDVMLASCGEMIVFHDESLERVTSVKGKVEDFSYDYLKILDAGSWFNPQFANEKIPTLKQVLECLAQHSLGVNIELKPLPGKEEALAKKVLALLQATWPQNLPAPLFSSFSIQALRALRRHSSTCSIGFLMDEIFSGWEKIQAELNCASLNVNQEVLNPSSIQDLKRVNLPLLSYTVNNPARARELFASGVDVFFTDCPDRIIEVISHLNIL